ncbi:hypothetical protein CALVIDRAFT_436280 [Calocera viscosa TUFC12733]|uniref:Zn(2)-C6 fungal-type domain-containing protein n=1 Tax=Calocera viscosa (strain TUFC12733) TaxID=1330018 RepID=A0A167FVK4_CALVF|nr:hypothetical protein CALVIDRAFT_436280 [Calocera viscosa TUFC12733]
MGGDHPCPVCKATFTRPQHVARHMRSHTGDRPYKCQQCGDQFARSDLLSRHVNKCHSNNPQPAGRGKGAAANQELDDKRRACDQCNHSKVRCDFGIPCGKCLQRKTICTYAKPPKKTVGKKGDYSDASSTSTTSSLYDPHVSNMPGMSMSNGVPLHYINPTGTMSNDYGLQPAGVPLFNGIGNDFMHMQAARNMYDSPSPNPPSLTMSVSTLESAGSSPETQNLSNSPNGPGGKGRPRSLTVPTQTYQYPQQVYAGANGPMSAYPYVGNLTTNNVNALSQSMSIPSNWPMLQGDSSNYMSNMGTDTASQHTRNPSVASSMDASSLSNWNGSTDSAPTNNGLMYSMGNAPTVNTNLNNNMFPPLDMTNFMSDDYGRPPTAASDGGFATALDGLTLHDSDMYGDANALYQQYLTNSMPAPQQTMPAPAENLPTGQTPDLWAAFMSEPFGDNTPTTEKQQQNANGLGMPSPLKGFRPQLITRLSKSNSMPDLTPLGKGSTPRGYNQQQQQQDAKPQISGQQSRTPGEASKATVPPGIADAESLKAYQQACLARQAPALKLSPKFRTGRSPISDNRDGNSAHLASTLSIQSSSPMRGRPTNGASPTSSQNIGRPQSTSQPPQQNKMPYQYGQAQPSRPGSNLRPPEHAATGQPSHEQASPVDHSRAGQRQACIVPQPWSGWRGRARVRAVRRRRHGVFSGRAGG